jgi:predicted RNA-binding Zn ribbon-like protein
MSPPGTKSPFEYTGGNLALDFVNTIDSRGSETRKDLLKDYASMVQWAEGAKLIGGKTGDRLRRLAGEAPGQAQSVLRHAIQLREAIYDIFSAVVERRAIPSAALACLNDTVQKASEHAQITHVSKRFAWEWIQPDENLDSILWFVARAASELLTSDDLAYVGTCASEPCGWLFLDQTKNHRRRWCEMKTCGNRDKARRYYHRQRD